MMLLQELDHNYHAVEREFAPVSCVKADWSMKVFCAGSDRTKENETEAED